MAVTVVSMNSMRAEEFGAAVLKACLAAARDPGTSAEKLTDLSSHPNNEIRYWVGANPNCPHTVLRWLAEDRVVDVVACVALNPASPLDLLEKVRRRFARRYPLMGRSQFIYSNNFALRAFGRRKRTGSRLSGKESEYAGEPPDCAVER